MTPSPLPGRVDVFDNIRWLTSPADSCEPPGHGYTRMAVLLTEACHVFRIRREIGRNARRASLQP